MSDDFRSKLLGLSDEVGYEWTEAQAQSAERAVLRRVAGQKARRKWALRGAAAAAIVLGMIGLREAASTHGAGKTAATEAPFQSPETEPGPATERFDDGSTARALTPATVFRTQRGPRSTSVDIVRGGVRFEVPRNAGRSFRIDAGPAAVEVFGASFSVEQVEQRVHVAVERGHVRVTWADRSADLYDGQSDVFPPDEQPPAGDQPHSRRAVRVGVPAKP
jgi:ferric-dicitrate binding protein FerR (iron transport regulator)